MTTFITRLISGGTCRAAVLAAAFVLTAPAPARAQADPGKVPAVRKETTVWYWLGTSQASARRAELSGTYGGQVLPGQYEFIKAVRIYYIGTGETTNTVANGWFDPRTGKWGAVAEKRYLTAYRVELDVTGYYSRNGNWYSFTATRQTSRYTWGQ